MADQEKRYTLTIHVAAPGTPLLERDPDGSYVRNGKQSTPGHFFLTVSDGSTVHSYGFAPAKEGDMHGPGKVYLNDVHHYEKPLFARQMEITSHQYEAVHEFANGVRNDRGPFSSHYNAGNNCVDFGWAALRHAGIYRGDLQIDLPGNRLDIGVKSFEGWPRPLDNIDAIKAIPAPFPGSELNQSWGNDKPKKTDWKQRLFGVDGLQNPDHPLHRDFANIQTGVAAMDAAANKPRDMQSANMEMSLLHLAVRHDIRADWAMLGVATEHVQAGKNVFVGQGEPTALPRQWVHMETQAAISTPVEQSLQRIEALQSERAQIAQVAHSQAQSPDASLSTERTGPRVA